MADKKTCNESVNMIGDFYKRCGNKAKFACRAEYGKIYRCGIHAKRYQKIEEIKQ